MIFAAKHNEFTVCLLESDRYITRQFVVQYKLAPVLLHNHAKLLSHRNLTNPLRGLKHRVNLLRAVNKHFANRWQECGGTNNTWTTEEDVTSVDTSVELFPVTGSQR